ncbi:hypothetical protein HX037_06595 [Ignatzschineria indica]|uniref:hypothetical protein n=1 Tax=Ignatzschineria indica TaxID=472583 RepID=UPI0025773EDA|nr:hypothetical protein [Ignatzschineria indica]MDM1545552.1 hypothetical protein [Ignatzschineria indica]
MNIIKRIKQRAQRHIENKRIKRNARLYKEIEIANAHVDFSLEQIRDVIAHEEQKLARMSFFNTRRKHQQILVAGLHSAKRLISNRQKSLERPSTIANAPKVTLVSKCVA